MKISTLASSLLAAALVAACPTPAHAVSPVRFSGAQYDSPGSDSGSNSSLNAEWIRITNHSTSNRTMTGWTVRDPQGHVFRFPSGYVLRAGRTVKIHTGNGSNSSTDLYWHENYYVWNNTGDRATLKNGAGTTVDTCSWGDGSGYTGC